MRSIKAYKAQLSFGETDKYHVFLKQQILNLNPQYYVVSQKQKIITDDGIMYVLRIVKDVEIPNLELIAECLINTSLIYLWRDHCWTIAVDKYQRPIIKYDQDKTRKRLQHESCNKTIIIHRIGTSQV